MQAQTLKSMKKIHAKDYFLQGTASNRAHDYGTQVFEDINLAYRCLGLYPDSGDEVRKAETEVRYVTLVQRFSKLA